MKNIALIILIVFAFPVFAQEYAPVEILLNADKTAPQGQGVQVEIHQKIKSGWHTYYKNPGDAGLPAEITWDMPSGFKAGEIAWPQPKTIMEGDFTTYGYHDNAVLTQEIFVPKDAQVGDVTLNAKVDLLVCKDICIPQTIEKSLNISITKAQGEPVIRPWIVAIALAFLGGMILNLMPCVFPVLALKSISFIEKHEKSGALHGVAYACGVILTFLIIAGVLIAIKGAGMAAGWGFHLQEPLIVTVLIWLLFAIALNLAGMFEAKLPFHMKMPKTSGFLGDMATGGLVTLVATPCTAPFMAAALGYALVQPAVITLSVFAALGAGLAAPYVLLTIIPSADKLIPKQGAWMERFRQFLAFPMLAAAIWLVWVLTRQSGADAMAIGLIGAAVIAFSAWMKRLWPLAILVVLMFSIAAPSAGAKNFGKVWTPTALEAALSTDSPVFVEITADWCITCKTNHAVSINRKATKDLFEEQNVTYLIGNWTSADPQITAYLQSFNRQGVPLYVVYDAPINGVRAPSHLLPQILTPDTLHNAFIRKADQ